MLIATVPGFWGGGSGGEDNPFPAPQSIQSARLSVLSSELDPPPLHLQASVAPPSFGSKMGDTLACGGGGGRTQFQRKDRHSGTVCTVYYNPSTPCAHHMVSPMHVAI